MAVVRDTSIASAVVATATQTRSITIGAGTDRLLLVQVNLGAHGGPGTSGTLSATAIKGGVATAMSTDATNGKALSNLGDYGYTQFFYMADPDVGANSIVITRTGGTGTQDILSAAVSYNGAGTPVFTKATGHSTAISVTFTIATGDFAVAGACAGAGITAGSDTKLWGLNDNTNSGAGNQWGAERSSGSGSISMTNTIGSSDDWGTVGVKIPPASTSSNTGTLSGTLPKVTGSIAGAATDPGTVSATLPKVTGSVAGTSTNPGATAATLPKVTGSLTGSSTNPGAASGTLPKLTGSITGTATNTGTIAGTFPKVTGAVADTSSNAGTLTATLPAVTGSIAGASSNPGTLAGTFPKVVGQIADTTLVTGAVDANLPRLTADLAGQSTNPGTLTGPLPALTGALAGTSTNAATLVATFPAVIAGSLGITQPHQVATTDRLLVVRAENRVLAIPVEDRRRLIPAENRRQEA